MGEALRLLRIFNGYKSAELAKKLELSQSYVSELENGKKQPTMEVLDKYAKVFEMKKSTLMLFAESLEGEEIKNDKKPSHRKVGRFLLSKNALVREHPAAPLCKGSWQKSLIFD